MSKSSPFKIALGSPCHERFAEMRRLDPQRRFCDSCQTPVHDLSSMSQAEAVEILERARDEDVCVRYLHDAEQRPVFRDSPALVPLARLTRGVAVAALALAPALIEACGGAPRRWDYYNREETGEPLCNGAEPECAPEEEQTEQPVSSSEDSEEKGPSKTSLR